MDSPFDLQTALATWRAFHARRRVFSSEDLDELEVHLRAHIKVLQAEGQSPEAAFREAMRDLGDLAEAEGEYEKVYWGKLQRKHTLIQELTWRTSMLKNYLKITFRTLSRHKGYSLINIAGLAFGLACCILIFQFVAFQTSFDDFHEKADRIYRIAVSETRSGEEPRTSAMIGFGASPAFAAETPEIVRQARIRPDFFQEGPTISYKDADVERAFKEQRAFFADSALLSMFTYSFVGGNPATALRQPQTLLLTESTARKYFGPENPVGKTLEYASANISGTYTVTGVLKDLPANAHFQFDVLLPLHAYFDNLERRVADAGGDLQNSAWNANPFEISAYVELRAGADLQRVEQKLTDVLYQNTGEKIQARNAVAAVQLQPLRSLYLDATTVAGRIETGDARAVYFFLIIALITLAIALANYANLSTARAIDRAREVGVRKAIGAERRQLIGQFLLESVVVNLIALVLAFVLAVLLAPFVSALTNSRLGISAWGSGLFMGGFLVVFVAGVFLSGLYPAFILSSFRPVSVLKGKVNAFGSRVNLRKALVVLQFAASMVLLVGTGVVYTQLNYMRQMDVGLDLEQVVIVTSPRILEEGMDSKAAERALQEEVRRLPGVTGTTYAGNVAGSGTGFVVSAPAYLETADVSTAREMNITGIDHAFTDVYGIELVAGRGFREGMPTAFQGPLSLPRSALINEAAVRALGLPSSEAALDQVIVRGPLRFIVIGVLKDFNWSSAHQPAEPVLFRYNPTNRFLSIKVSEADLPGTMAALQKTFEQLFPGNPFDYQFADEVFDAQYRRDERFATLFSLFAGLAILIACLGLFGLASFTAARRTKEIGIRKVLGASLSSIVGLLSKDFLKLVVLAFFLAVPLAYLAMGRWLDNFAYRIELGPGVFVIAGVCVLLVAILAVSYQSVRAALADPVNSLHYE